MRLRSGRRCLTIALLVIVGLGAVTGSALVAGSTGAPERDATGFADGTRAPVATADQGAPVGTLQDQPDADATVTRIELRGNGSATWTIEVRTRLEDGDEVAQYESFQERFRSNRSQYIAAFEERMTGVVANANESLARPMAAGEFRAETYVEEAPQRWGVIAYEFRWDGFAAGGDGSVTVGDVFGGNFFIEENSVLKIALPADHDVETVEPAPDRRTDRTLEWEGPTSFADGQPHLVAATGDGTGLPLATIGGVVLALLVVPAGVLAWRRGVFDQSDDATDERVPESRKPDPEPVTDEDRVENVLAASGGRCKQSRIVEDLDWSKSKTSRVLSRMAEEDRITKRQIGRENVIELTTAEDEVTAEG